MAAVSLTSRVLSEICHNPSPLTPQEVADHLNEGVKEVRGSLTYLLKSKKISRKPKKEGIISYAITPKGLKALDRKQKNVRVVHRTMEVGSPYTPESVRAKVYNALLNANQPVGVSDLVRELGLTSPSVSSHLYKIQLDGLLRKTGAGRSTRYALINSTSPSQNPKRKYTKKINREVPQFTSQIELAVSALGKVAVRNQELEDALNQIQNIINQVKQS